MGQITQDGYTFNSDCIDHRIAMLTDSSWAAANASPDQ